MLDKLKGEINFKLGTVLNSEEEEEKEEERQGVIVVEAVRGEERRRKKRRMRSKRRSKKSRRRQRIRSTRMIKCKRYQNVLSLSSGSSPFLSSPS